MVKNIFIILSLIIAITTQTYTMEMEVNPIEMCIKIEPFPLLLLPLDIQDLIASFLPFHDTESEQEFIKRTKRRKEIPAQYLINNLPKFECNSGLKTNSVFCPNNKTIALLCTLQNRSSNNSPTLIIINRDNNQKLYTIEINKRISDIALSRNPMFAIIHSERDHSRGKFTEVIRYKKVLSIKNIITQKEESHIIPNSFSITYNNSYPTIAFNKQGTHVILRGYDHEQGHYDDEEVCFNPLSKQNIQKPVHHKIFPLTTTFDQNSDNKKTLAKYFKQRAVCKDFIKQIPRNNIQVIREPSNTSNFAIPMHENYENENINFIQKIYLSWKK